MLGGDVNRRRVSARAHGARASSLVQAARPVQVSSPKFSTGQRPRGRPQLFHWNASTREAIDGILMRTATVKISKADRKRLLRNKNLDVAAWHSGRKGLEKSNDLG